MTKDFQDYGFRGDIAKIYGGDKGSDAPIVVTTWQSMMRMPKGFGNEFGMVLEMKLIYFKLNHLQRLWNH